MVEYHQFHIPVSISDCAASLIHQHSEFDSASAQFSLYLKHLFDLPASVVQYHLTKQNQVHKAKQFKYR
jgi:hypothetical protein